MTDYAALSAELLTIVLALATVFVAIIRPIGRVRRRLLLRPLRIVSRKPKRWGIEEDLVAAYFRSPSEKRKTSEPKVRKAFVDDLGGSLLRVLDGEDVLPADVLAYVNSKAWLRNRTDSLTDQALVVSEILRAASTSRAQGLLARVLYPEDVRAMRELLRNTSTHLQDFAGSKPVVQENQTQGIGDSQRPYTFADFASALSGAMILTDSVEWRSRFAAKVLLWHRRLFRHASYRSPDESVNYESKHPGGQACDLYGFVADRKIGDFDRRVLDLRAVIPVASSSRGWTGFLLDTGETCYLTTEQGAASHASSSRAPTTGLAQVSPIGSKHLLPQSGGGRSVLLKRSKFGIELHQSDQRPVVVVTSYVSIITSDNCLALVNRSRVVRHGNSVISATAGGVVEPDGEGSDGDIDPSGMPSVLQCVIREAREEIGLVLEPSTVRPVVVFLSNIRSRANVGKDLGDSESRQNDRAGRGQVVAVVLFLAHVSEAFETLKESLIRADPALGAFEVENLTPVAMQMGEESECLAAFAREHATELDQHGLLSCLYTAATVNGPDRAMKAFTEAFPDQPWWMTGVSGSDIRLVRDPRELVDPPHQAIHSEVPWESIGPASWEASWRDLSKNLDQARDQMANDQ